MQFGGTTRSLLWFRKINSSNTGWERPELFAVRVNKEPRAQWVQVRCPDSRSSPGPHYSQSHVHRKGGERPFLCVAQLTPGLPCLALGFKAQKGLEQIQQNEFEIWMHIKTTRLSNDIIPGVLEDVVKWWLLWTAGQGEIGITFLDDLDMNQNL